MQACMACHMCKRLHLASSAGIAATVSTTGTVLIESEHSRTNLAYTEIQHLIIYTHNIT